MGNTVVKQLGADEINAFYELGEKLGKGSFAQVVKAKRKSDGLYFAVKIIKKGNLNPEELAVLHDEVDIMARIANPHCVKLTEMYESKKKLYVVMELLAGGELFDRIAKRGFSERQAAIVLRDITLGLKYLHDSGIVHRDMKPENLIYANDSDESIAITDYGLAKYRPPEGTHKGLRTSCGTPGYVAPEILNNVPYGPEVDMWSLGVILYIILCGFPPFYHESTAALYKQIKKGEYDFPDPFWAGISEAAKEVVRGLLTVDPEKRMTPKQVLTHPWISSDAASSKGLGPGRKGRIKAIQARKVLRKAVNAVMAVNRMTEGFHNALEESSSDESLSDDDLDGLT